MVKNIGIALLCVALGTTVYARSTKENQKFIGVEVSITEVQGAQPKDISDDVSYGIRVGAQNEQWRTMFILNYFDSGDHNVEKLFLSVDYFFLKTNLVDNYAVQPYLGINIGYMNYESKENISKGIPNVDADGFLYGFQGGVVLDVTENIGFDVGYRYSLSSADEFDHSGDVVFGLNYQY